MSTNLDIATWLAAQGMHVFPLRPLAKRPMANCAGCKAGHTDPQACRCLTADRPCHGLLAASRAAQQISPRTCGRKTPKYVQRPACMRTTPASASQSEPVSRRQASRYNPVRATSARP